MRKRPLALGSEFQHGPALPLQRRDGLQAGGQSGSSETWKALRENAGCVLPNLTHTPELTCSSASSSCWVVGRPSRMALQRSSSCRISSRPSGTARIGAAPAGQVSVHERLLQVKDAQSCTHPPLSSESKGVFFQGSAGSKSGRSCAASWGGVWCWTNP